jgi:hypothetical protein
MDGSGSEAYESSSWGELRQAVMGGTVAPEGRWDEVSAHSCSGVLIASRWVLTAGHCTLGNSDVQLRHRQEEHAVIDAIPHPDWDTTLDVGLLELGSDAIVEPATLAFGCGSHYVTDGAPVQIVGYGATGPNGSQYNAALREATTAIVDADCSGDDWSCFAPGKELIAGHPGVDTCPGDSGGPLYVLTDGGPLLAGITSRAANPGATPSGGVEEPCGSVPGLYVRTDALVDWIEDTTGEPLREPDCGGLGAPAESTRSESFTASGQLAQGERRQLDAVDVQPGTQVSVTMTGSGDADLYVRFGGRPTYDRYDCRPYLETSEEECVLGVPEGVSRLFVMVDGYTESSFELVGEYVAPR